MRVLAITYCRAMFGANIALVEMIKDLKNRYNVETEVLMPSVNDGTLSDILNDMNVTYYEMPMKMWVCSVKAKHKQLRKLSIQLKTFFLSKNIYKLFKGKKYDIIYSNNSTVQYGAILSHKMHIPHVWHIREFGPLDYGIEFCFPNSKIVKYYKDANTVVAISEAVKEYAQTKICSGAKIVRIYDGISLNKKYRHPLKMSKIKIAYIAALQPGKNHLDLLKAALVLKNKGYSNIEYCFIGDGPEKDKLKLFCEENSIDTYVKFYGYRTDVRKLLDSMDIGVICSLSEGFGLVTCEYMESSLPIVGANSGATPELIKNNYNGFLYSSGNTDEFAAKLQCLIDSYELREVFGRNAYNMVNDMFSINKNTDNMFNIFLNAAKKNEH